MKENTSTTRHLPALLMPDMIAPLIAPLCTPEWPAQVSPGRPIAPVYDFHAATSDEERERVCRVSAQVADYELYELLRLTAKELRRRGFDLSHEYDDLDLIGEALASNYDELGRELYHDFTANNREYRKEVMDTLYDAWLRHKSNIRIDELVALVKGAGVEIDRLRGISLPKPFVKHLIASRGVLDPNPTASFFGNTKIETYMLPWMIQDIIEYGETPEEKDLLLLGSLTVMSSMMPNVEFLYNHKRYYPNLYLFVSGPAASGKGAVEPALELARPLHEMQAQKRQAAIDDWKRRKAQKEEGQGPCPSFAAHIIPANTTSTAFYRRLFDQNGRGLLFETEADTLSSMLKNKDYGNFSDGLRKAFHHETIQYQRKTDNEHAEIYNPQLSVCLTGTPNQIGRLVENVENGLFSRFMFYSLEPNLEWRSQFGESDEEPISDIFYRHGETLLQYYKQLSGRREPLRFTLTPEQKNEFDDFFRVYLPYLVCLLGDGSAPNVKRIAISAYRIALVLGMLRYFEEGEAKEVVVCRDSDFYFAMHVVEVMLCHLSKAFSQLGVRPREEHTDESDESRLLKRLGERFTRADFAQCSDAVGIEKSRHRRLLDKLVREKKVLRIDHGLYTKAA